MKKYILKAGFVAVLSLSISCKTDDRGLSTKDPKIIEAVAAVSQDSLKVYIDELVSFHTRHTLSTQGNPSEGIGGAMDYLARRCETWSRQAPAERPAPVVEKVIYTVGENGGRTEKKSKSSC